MDLILILLIVLFGVGLGYGGSYVVCPWLNRHWRARPVIVNGLHISHALVQAVRDRRGDWAPRGGVYPFGSRCKHHLQLFVPMERSGDSGDRLTRLGTEAARFAHASDAWMIDPGYIPAITDFSKIIECGSASQNPVCLDYRDDPQSPSVIFWTGAYWRRVGANVDAFLTLLEPWDHRKHGYPRPRSPAEQEEAEAILSALSETSSYDIWDDRVLVHVVYSVSEEPTVVLLPTSKSRESSVAPETDWQIQVTLPRGSLPQPMPGQAVRVATSGLLRTLNPDSQKRKLSQAAVVALSQLRHLCPPGILLVWEVQKGYFVDWTHLPEVIDGQIASLLTEDLRLKGERG